MHFNTQLVYFIGTESLTGAIIVIGLMLILGIIHNFFPSFSRRHVVGWIGIAGFIVPFWYMIRWIMHVGISGYLYGAISDEISMFYGSFVGRWAAVILIIWAAGLLCGFVLFILKQIRLRRIIKESVRVNDPSILYLLEELQESFGICHDITILYNPALTSPGCAGIWKPCIVMNQAAIKRENVYSVLCHELIHIKKKDVLFQYVIDIVSIFHWFNPLIHLFRFVMMKQMEYGCDTYALWHTGWRVSSEDYIATISRVIQKKEKKMVYVLPFGGKYEERKNRVRYLKKMASIKWKTSTACIVLMGIIFLSTSVTVCAANETFTNSYITWLKSDTSEVIYEGEGEPIKECESEYVTEEVETEEEQELSWMDRGISANWLLMGKQTMVSEGFEGSAGEYCNVTMSGNTGDDYEVGIIQPDGKTIWVHVNDKGMHEFKLEQNGKYRLAVKNNLESELQVDVMFFLEKRSVQDDYMVIS